MDTLIMNNGLIYTQLVMMEEEVVKEALVVALPKLFMRPREGTPCNGDGDAKANGVLGRFHLSVSIAMVQITPGRLIYEFMFGVNLCIK